MTMLKALLLFIVLWAVAPVYGQSDATEIPADIRSIFPTATRVGEQHSDLAVTPVYQLQQLLGYVFESNHFVDFIGFSGKPINVLIGIDELGHFRGLQVLSHSEPIFLHGLGEQSLRDFIAQYVNHNVRERFIIGGTRKSGTDATYFDGVTKATVSVLVINDTIITSALAVARAKLDGFVTPSNKVINPDYFELLSFSELVARGFIHEHTVTTNELSPLASEIRIAAEEAMATWEQDAMDKMTESGVFSQHYYTFISLPIVGKNLLSPDEYARLQENLKPGEEAIMVFHTQGFGFVSDDFIPQTAPEHFRLHQGGFAIDARDIDFYSFHDPSFAQTLPQYQEVKVLRVKSQGGLSLDQTMNMAISLPYKPSFFTLDQHQFELSVTLPEELFMDNPNVNTDKVTPLWQQMWQNRWLEIAITASYLLGVSIFFGQQRKLVRHTRLVHSVRFCSLVFVLFFIGCYAQGQLSVVNIYTLLLDLTDGFSVEVYLLDPVIFMLWSFVFVSLFVVGRGLYCGWLCPFGALQELIGIVAQKLKIKQWRIKPQHHKQAQKIKYVLLVGLLASAFYSLTLAEKLAEIEPFKTSITLFFVRYWPFVLYAITLLVLSLKIHKVYCRYICPLGAGLAMLGRFPLVKLLIRRDECGNPCQLCRQKKCAIDAINTNGSIDYAECIQCLECVVTIDNPELCKIDKYKKKKVPTRVTTLDSVRP